MIWLKLPKSQIGYVDVDVDTISTRLRASVSDLFEKYHVKYNFIDNWWFVDKWWSWYDGWFGYCRWNIYSDTFLMQLQSKNPRHGVMYNTGEKTQPIERHLEDVHLKDWNNFVHVTIGCPLCCKLSFLEMLHEPDFYSLRCMTVQPFNIVQHCPLTSRVSILENLGLEDPNPTAIDWTWGTLDSFKLTE